MNLNSSVTRNYDKVFFNIISGGELFLIMFYVL